jgi:hypothetical protein
MAGRASVAHPAGALMKIPRHLDRDTRGLARLACRQGWVLQWRGGGHIAWRAPGGSVVISSGSPSDWRARLRLRADLRRHGLARAQ